MLGEHRVFPDFAAIPYTELVASSQFYGGAGYLAASDYDPETFDPASLSFSFVGGGFYGAGFAPEAGNDTDFNAQFLYQLFDFGIGDLVLSDPMIGDTPLTDYDDVTVQNQTDIDLVAGNVDAVQGQDLETGIWVTRRSSLNTTKIVVNLISQRYEVTDNGDVRGQTNEFKIRYRRYDETDP